MRLPAGAGAAGRLPAPVPAPLTTSPPPATIRAAEALTEPEALHPAGTASLANPLVHTNAAAIGEAAYASWLYDAYAARHARLPAVTLGRYPAGTLLDGQGSFQCLVGGGDGLVAEQVRFPGEDVARTLASLHTRAARGVVEVDRPCLLACRYGEWTWGHWLLDMLPKVVAAERAAPHRFTYAVPFGIVDEAVGGGFARSVVESLAAYGVESSRLLRVHPDHVYRFASLHDVAGVSGKHLHPGVLEAMRDVAVPAAPRRALTAVLRAPPSIRPLLNAAGVRRVLEGSGAGFLDPLAAGFPAQVAAFRDSDVVVGDLGSNLAAAIYAHPGAGLVTMGPTRWQDDYFCSLFARVGLLQADIRGFAVPSAGKPFHHAPYAVDPAHVAEGLDAVRRARQAPPGGSVVLDGRTVPRRLGASVWQAGLGSASPESGLVREGFGQAEADGAWSLGPASRLTLPRLHAGGHDAWLEVAGLGLVSPPHLVSRPIAVSLGGVQVAEAEVGASFRLHVPVSVAMLAAGPLVIGLHHPVCPSPASLGMSSDRRPLGVMVQRLALHRRLPD